MAYRQQCRSVSFMMMFYDGGFLFQIRERRREDIHLRRQKYRCTHTCNRQTSLQTDRSYPSKYVTCYVYMYNVICRTRIHVPSPHLSIPSVHAILPSISHSFGVIILSSLQIILWLWLLISLNNVMERKLSVSVCHTII